MKNPIEYIEKLFKSLERKIFSYIIILTIVILGILLYSNFKSFKYNLSEISFNSNTNKAYCITANANLPELSDKFRNLEILKNEKFSCYKDMETCYEHIDNIWYDASDYINSYYKIEQTYIIKSQKYNNNRLVGGWWENNVLKVYCMEVSVVPTEEGEK